MQAVALKSLVKRMVAQVRPAGPKGTVLLTFDDGPDPMVTPQILDLLDHYGTQSIFFVVGNRIPKAPHILTEIVRRGHALGNHSFSHRTGLGYAARVADMRACSERIQQLACVRPLYYRPPEGKLDFPTVLASWRERTPLMLWSTDTADWRVHDPHTAREKADRLAQELSARPSASEILLFHDYNPQTLVMLEGILPRLAEAGRLFTLGKS